MNKMSRGSAELLQTKSNYGTAPVTAPTAAAKEALSRVRGGSLIETAEDCYVILKADAAATLGASGSVWLMRYSHEHSLWLKCARLGGGNPIVLSATLGHDEPIRSVLSDTEGFDLYDEGGGALGANVTLSMGRFLRN
jgi:hypothetical protein